MNRAAPEPKDNMGQPAPRVEARLKVTGEARYASDMPVNNPAFAFLVTSPIAKGEIKPAKDTALQDRTLTPPDLGPQHALGRYVTMVTCAECSKKTSPLIRRRQPVL